MAKLGFLAADVGHVKGFPVDHLAVIGLDFEGNRSLSTGGRIDITARSQPFDRHIRIATLRITALNHKGLRLTNYPVKNQTVINFLIDEIDKISSGNRGIGSVDIQGDGRAFNRHDNGGFSF